MKTQILFFFLWFLIACDDTQVSRNLNIDPMNMDQMVSNPDVDQSTMVNMDQKIDINPDAMIQDMMNPNQNVDINDILSCNTAPYLKEGQFVVGFQEREVDGQKIAIWYPATRGSEVGKSKATYDMRDWLPEMIASQIPNDGAPIFEMNAYADLEAAQGNFPVVIFAHGLAGYRLQSSMLMAHLASWGMIVTSAENKGIHLPVILGGGAPTMDQGAELMRLTYAQLNDWNAEGVLSNRIDLSKIAVMGHSMGTGAATAVSLDEFADTWVALAGAGFGAAAPNKPFLMMGGSTDALAVPSQIDRAYQVQTADIHRKVVIEKAGHLAFSDICAIARDRGGLLAVASEYGLDIPVIITRLGQDGCRPTDLPVEKAWPIIHHFVTAHLRNVFGVDQSLLGYDAQTIQCLDQYITSFDREGLMMENGGSMNGGSMNGGSMNGGSMNGGSMENVQTPGIPNEVSCGMQSCDITTNYCCVGLQGSSCQVDPCGGFSATQTCDGPEDCQNNQVCCVGFPSGSACFDGCNATQERLCHLDSECPSGQACALCTYPGNSEIRLCSSEGRLPAGALSCEPLSPQDPNMQQGGMMMEMNTETGMAGVVNCGASSCDLSANVCCVGFNGQECIAGNRCDFAVAQICDGTEDCGLNQVCCMTFGLGLSFSCTPNQCGGFDTKLCSSQDQCADGEVCKNCLYPSNVRLGVCGPANTLAAGALSCE